MAKVSVLVKGCYALKDGVNVELALGDNEVSDSIAANMVKNGWAIAVVEMPAVDKPKK